jgi:hypothetical protein
MDGEKKDAMTTEERNEAVSRRLIEEAANFQTVARDSRGFLAGCGSDRQTSDDRRRRFRSGVDGLLVKHGGAANTFEALLGIGAIRPVGDAEGEA